MNPTFPKPAAVTLALAALLCQGAHAQTTTASLAGWSVTGDAVSTSGAITLTTAFRDGDAAGDQPFNLSGTSAADIAAIEGAAGVATYGLDLPGAALNTDLAGTEGSLIGQSFAVSAGQTLTFSWSFGSNDTRFLDHAFVVIDGSVFTLATTAAPGGTTQSFSHLFAGTGAATLALGVIDTGDVLGVSSLTVGDLKLSAAVGVVPEPSTWALLAGGLGIVGWCARRRARTAA